MAPHTDPHSTHDSILTTWTFIHSQSNSFTDATPHTSAAQQLPLKAAIVSAGVQRAAGRKGGQSTAAQSSAILRERSNTVSGTQTRRTN
jgi:hypothetical protein